MRAFIAVSPPLSTRPQALHSCLDAYHPPTNTHVDKDSMHIMLHSNSCKIAHYIKNGAVALGTYEHMNNTVADPGSSHYRSADSSLFKGSFFNL